MTTKPDGWRHSPESAVNSYQTTFVPAIFRHWAQDFARWAKPETSVDVALDVACGTGESTRALVSLLPGTQFSGLDVSPAMLDMAKSLDEQRDVKWFVGDAQALPFEESSFDLVVCHLGLQFFEDKGRAASEFARVARNRCRVYVSTWADIDKAPAFSALVASLQQAGYHAAAERMQRPFSMPDLPQVEAAFHGAGFQELKREHRRGQIRFQTPREFALAFLTRTTLSNDLEEQDVTAIAASAENKMAGSSAWDGIEANYYSAIRRR